MSNTRTLTKSVVSNIVTLDETLAIGADPAMGVAELNPSVGQKWLFDGTTGPLATVSYHAQITMAAGTATIDLTALTDPDTGGTLDLTGLKLKMMHLAAPSVNANAVTVKPGSSNGYTGWVGTNGEVLNASDQRGPNIYNGGIAVDATHKTIDITGTGAQQVNIVALFG